MTMQMTRAFNAKMETSVTLHVLASGSYDSENVWQDGALVSTEIRGVLTTGNKFSQFDEGESHHSEDGGIRYSDYKTLYVRAIYNVDRANKITHRGVHYNVLQRSNELVFGFYKVLLEESTEWTP